MANLSSANVTVLASWRTGATNGKRNIVKSVKWTNTTAGDGTDKLLASAFGLAKIIKCSNVLLDATSKLIIPAVPSADGSEILTADPTDGTLNSVATSTDYAYATIEGV